MFSQKNQKFRKGVQATFLEKVLKENQKILEQLENVLDSTTGKQQERPQTLEKTSKIRSNIAELTKAVDYSKKTEYFEI